MDCAICLLEITDNKNILNCNHVFHEDCIEKWYKISHHCPLCRNSKFDITLKEYEKHYWGQDKKIQSMIKENNKNIFKI